MRIIVSLLLLSATISCLAQSNHADSVKVLQPVLIQAYATDRPISEVPVSIGYVDADNLKRFNNTSILPALNAVPGVRMEERSPGSYRFSIRGSLLRSPFGVRNVKAYWNGLPLTDGGGNTYLNLLDFNAIGTIEVIKGPGGSLYGAGTGGVLLINSPQITKDQSEISVLTGSYGLRRYQINKQIHSEKVNVRLQYARQQYGGYRDQTEMTRDAFNADVTFQVNSESALTANLFYTTPGGLTQAQYQADPRQARPSAGPNRGAVEQRAAVTNKTPFLGLTYEHDFDDRWSTRVGLFGSHADFSNPTIRNYEVRDETNIGGRAETQYKFGEHQRKRKVTLGGEYQYFKSPIAIYGNNGGRKDTLQTQDRLSSRLMLLFAQAELHLPANFYLTVGSSINFIQYDFERTYPMQVNEERDLEPAFSPRIALLNKITPGFSVFGSISQGFSPPGLAELYPSRQIFDKNIEAERGNNYELGFRGSARKHRLNFDLTVYSFQLKKTLVIRRDTTLLGDPDYFVNAGSTSQRGVEAMISWEPVKNGKRIVSGLKIWNSYTYNHYRFQQYAQGENDYSGNMLTGVPPTVNTSGLDITIKRKLYLNVTGNYVDRTPLDDANTVFANDYYLLGARLGFITNIGKSELEIFTGIDNALDKKYSLGNDLNAAGGRYFNAAAPENYYAGLRLKFAR